MSTPHKNPGPAAPPHQGGGHHPKATPPTTSPANPGVTTAQSVPAFAAMERAALGDFLAGVSITRDQGDITKLIPAVLSQDPAALNARTLTVSQIALGLLPVGVLDPAQKAVYGRQNYPTLWIFVENVAEAMGLAALPGLTFDVTPARLDELQKQSAAYAGIKLLGMQATNSAMDLRALVGAFLSFLIDQTLGVLDERFKDSQLTQAQRDSLLNDFGPALLALDEVLKQPVLRKQQLGAERQQLAGQLQDAHADEGLADTTLKLRQSLVVPRQDLFAAALRQKGQHGQASQHSGHQATHNQGAGQPLPPPTGSRRIV